MFVDGLSSSERLTRLLDRLSFFDISVQDIAKICFKFTVYPNWNPVGITISQHECNMEFLFNKLDGSYQMNLPNGDLCKNEVHLSELNW